MKPTLREGLQRRLMAILWHLHGGVIHTLDSSALILWLLPHQIHLWPCVLCGSDGRKCSGHGWNPEVNGLQRNYEN